jgi:alpha-1,6-mannosyltransferase
MTAVQGISCRLSMAGDASTLPLRPKATGSRLARIRARSRASERAAVDSEVRAGALALGAIVTLSLLLVVVAANRPSLLTPTTYSGYFPGWMAGPLGGLLPGFTNDGTVLKWLLTGSVAVMYACYLVVVRYSSRLSARSVIATIVAVQAIYLLSPPLALTDIFNYINYARMEVVHNLNPYTTIPVLEPHDDPSYLLSNWHELLSPYGPMFTMLTFVVVPLGVAGSFWALKSIIALMSLAILALVWKCARLLGRDPVSAIALAGLNPIVLVWGLGGDHNDFLMMVFIMLGLYLLLLARSRQGETAGPGGVGAWLAPLAPLQVGAGAAFVLAAAVKASGGVLIPVVLVLLARTPRSLVQFIFGAIAAALVVGALSLIAFGLHIPDLSTQSKLVTAESIPNLLGLAAGAGGESEKVRAAMSLALGLALLACCWQAWRRKEAITACGWASVALLATLGWVLPWYVLWVLPLAALSSSRRLRTVTFVFGVYLIVVWVPVSGGLWSKLGFYPQKTALGRLHQRYVKELLN